VKDIPRDRRRFPRSSDGPGTRSLEPCANFLDDRGTDVDVLEGGGLEIAAEGPSDSEAISLQDQLKIFAREIGVLYSAERVRSRELEVALDGARTMYLATMKSLAQVVEAKDPTTRGHLDRTAHYGLALARRIDPALAARPEVGYGFFLHDIGKVGVPESILCKPGPLTELEWIVMRSHPQIGAKIVEPIPFMGEAVEIVRSHHERWDGTGYPRRLQGEDIPLGARIFAIADSFDAMTSDRPYRRALSIEEAIEEILAGAGTQFDPSCVEVFVDLATEDEGDFLLPRRPRPTLAVG
jgi:HD-GYP domain-containing protein (c-di-GMP phosphodiesterase class II)